MFITSFTFNFLSLCCRSKTQNYYGKKTPHILKFCNLHEACKVQTNKDDNLVYVLASYSWKCTGFADHKQSERVVVTCSLLYVRSVWLSVSAMELNQVH